MEESKSTEGCKPQEFPNFQDLKKSTVSETYQYLNQLISKKCIHEFTNFNEIVSSNTPLPLFEEAMRIKVIDSLHLENEVVKILLSQNDYQIQRILGCKWFFRKLSSEFCTKQLFPYISISLRCKVINKLSKYLENDEEAEKYFLCIRNNYGSERAEYLLPRCSPQFILNYFEKSKPTFEHNNGIRILLNICKRYPEMGIHIISCIFDMKRNQFRNLYKYKKILWYMAGYHPDLIVPFLEKHHSYLPSKTFGRKLTKKLAPILKEQLFPGLVKNLIFKEKLLFSILSFKEQVKFIEAVVTYTSKNLTFSNWETSSSRVSHLLKWVRPENRLKMIEAAFNAVYSLKYSDYPSLWSPEMLELIPVKSRQPYVTKLYNILKGEKLDLNENEGSILFNTDRPEELIYLYDSATAFEKFKEILRKCPAVSRRERILLLLVKNNSINKDIQMLQEVVEFIATRHRNDDSDVICRFVEAIMDEFSETSLNCAIFEKLQDLMYFSTLKGYGNHYAFGRLMEKHIYCRLENNMNVETQINSLFNTKLLKMNYVGAFVHEIQSKHSKTLILALCEKIVCWIRTKSDEKEYSDSNILLMNLLNTCHHFNQSNKSNRIYLRDIPGLSELLKEKLKQEFRDWGAEDWSPCIWEKLYDKVMNSSYKQDCLSFALKQNPNIVVKYSKEILNILLTNYYKWYDVFFRDFLMAASFFGKLEKVKEILLNEFKNGDSISKRESALNLYSRVCTIEEFTEVIQDYLPKQEKVQGRSVDGFDEIQILIPELIKNIKPRWKNLQLILKFFFGDFLKSVLPSFWACCCNMRCDLAIPFLKEQLDAVPQKISYKKDIIRLIIELSDREGKFNFYLKCWDTYKHYSIRSILMLNISKSFLELPSSESFQLLEKCILDCDSLSIQSKPDLRKIPKEFWNDYISVLWKFSENQEDAFKNNFRRDILFCFDRDNIRLVSSEFNEAIIKNNLFNPLSELQVDDFTVLYLVADPDATERRVRMVLDLVKLRQPNSYCFYQFIHLLISKSMENPCLYFEIFAIILENWPDYPQGVLFEEKVLLTYHNLHQKVLKNCTDSSPAPSEFGKELRKLYSGVENLNDLLIIYAEALKKFFNSFETSDAILAVKELIAGPQDRTISILAILSLPQEAVVWYLEKGKIFEKNVIESKNILNEFVKTLESNNDDIVEIYLRSKFDFIKF